MGYHMAFLQKTHNALMCCCLGVAFHCIFLDTVSSWAFIVTDVEGSSAADSWREIYNVNSFQVMLDCGDTVIVNMEI